ncbi:hypothetical protein J2802_006620 [Paraburkholderia caribensis]|jgi:hypothetical protein|nr:hypothetical protein [Paraburkholderia caribensis]
METESLIDKGFAADWLVPAPSVNLCALFNYDMK